MVIIDKKDFQGAFVLLAIVYLLDTLLTGAIPLGVIVLLILAALVWLSGSEYASSVEGAVGNIDCEILLRATVAVIFIGVLIQNFYVLAAGLLIGSMLMFSSKVSLEADVMTLKVVRYSVKVAKTGKSKTG